MNEFYQIIYISSMPFFHFMCAFALLLSEYGIDFFAWFVTKYGYSTIIATTKELEICQAKNIECNKYNLICQLLLIGNILLSFLYSYIWMSRQSNTILKWKRFNIILPLLICVSDISILVVCYVEVVHKLDPNAHLHYGIGIMIIVICLSLFSAIYNYTDNKTSIVPIESFSIPNRRTSSRDNNTAIVIGDRIIFMNTGRISPYPVESAIKTNPKRERVRVNTSVRKILFNID